VKKGLEIVPVSTVDEVLGHALVAPLVPIEWNPEDEKTTESPIGSADEVDDRDGLMTH